MVSALSINLYLNCDANHYFDLFVIFGCAEGRFLAWYKGGCVLVINENNSETNQI